jgi:hypothetical protein
MTKKQKLIIAAVMLLIIAVIAGIFFLRRNKNAESNSEPEIRARRLNEPVNVIPVNERPYVNIVPKADGNHLDINIIHLNKPAKQVEYELEYQSGSMLQGAMGELQLASLPVTEEIFLGSCSAGGACTYHKDITSGNLLLTFIDSENFAVKTNWRYFDNTTRLTEVSSWDAKFQLESTDLSNIRYLIVFNSPGLPTGLEEVTEGEVELISDPYALTASSAISGTGQVVIRLLEDTQTATVAGFDGSSWTLFDTELEGKEARAEVTLMELFVVIK